MTRPYRKQQTRAAEARPVMALADARGRLDIDVSTIPSNLVPTWIRESIRGEYDDDNVQSALERGYRALEASELPGYQTHRLPGARGSKHQDDPLIRRGGMVLMVRDRRLADQERSLHAEETAESLRSVARETHGAPKDGKNFLDAEPEISVTTERNSGGRFAE